MKYYVLRHGFYFAFIADDLYTRPKVVTQTVAGVDGELLMFKKYWNQQQGELRGYEDFVDDDPTRPDYGQYGLHTLGAYFVTEDELKNLLDGSKPPIRCNSWLEQAYRVRDTQPDIWLKQVAKIEQLNVWLSDSEGNQR